MNKDYSKYNLEELDDFIKEKQLDIEDFQLQAKDLVKSIITGIALCLLGGYGLGLLIGGLVKGITLGVLSAVIVYIFKSDDYKKILKYIDDDSYEISQIKREIKKKRKSLGLEREIESEIDFDKSISNIEHEEEKDFGFRFNGNETRDMGSNTKGSRKK